MKEFVQLIREIDAQTSSNKRIQAVVNYFAKVSDEDKIWCIALFTAKRPKRALKSSLLRQWAAEISGIPDWLFEESYHIVGDLAETMALVLPEQKEKELEGGLDTWIRELSNLKSKSEEEQQEFITQTWLNASAAERFVFNKLLTGGWRIGMAKKNLIKALAIYSGQEENAVAHRLMGNWDPFSTSYFDLMQSNLDENLSRPYPFYLAYALENELEDLGRPQEWQVEWKWDGIRGQLVKRGGECFVWTRGEELVSEKYPELQALGALLPDGTVLDGEIVVHDGNEVLPFSLLQTRIARKVLSKKLLQEAPVKFIAYDLLEEDGKDLRPSALEKRRIQLEKIHAEISNEALLLSEKIILESWEDYALLRENSRSFRAEGFMLKRKNSAYRDGRKKGDWWKWKLDPLTIDAVLLYAMRGHGRRANLFTDYTFAVWDDDQLVPFAKAYSGLSDEEFKEVDRFVKKNTKDKFGPVRSVVPELVFEIAFEGIAESSRHKSGIALRFPRMSRWRKDKPVQEANTLQDLRNLLNIYRQDKA